MTKINIYLDDERVTPKGFVRTYTVEETIKMIEENEVDILSLDNDLGFIGQPDKEGFQVIRWLEDRHNPNNPDHLPMSKCPPPEKIVPHTGNYERKMDMYRGIRNLQRWKWAEEDKEANDNQE